MNGEEVIPLVAGGIYLLKARNLICGVYHNTKFYGFRSKFGEVFIDSEWSLTDHNTASGTAEAIKKIGQVNLPDECFAGGDASIKLWIALEAVDAIADNMWKEWYEEYTKNSRYKIDRLHPATLKAADEIFEQCIMPMHGCADDLEAEQFIEYIATKCRELIAKEYKP